MGRNPGKHEVTRGRLNVGNAAEVRSQASNYKPPRPVLTTIVFGTMISLTRKHCFVHFYYSRSRMSTV